MMYYDMDIWARETIFGSIRDTKLVGFCMKVGVLERRVLERRVMATRVVAVRVLVVEPDREPVAGRGTRCAPCVCSSR
jgi:hypothetical protein